MKASSLLLASIAFIPLLAGCADPADKHEATPIDQNRAAQLDVEAELIFSSCTGFLAVATNPKQMAPSFLPTEGWPDNGRPVVGYRTIQAFCERLSSPTGLVLTNVTWGVEGHTNIGPHQDATWSGAYNGLYQPLTLAGSEQALAAINWTVENLLGTSLVSLDFGPFPVAVASDATGVAKGNSSQYKLESTILRSEDPSMTEPVTYRYVSDPSKLEFVDVTYQVGNEGLATACSATASPEFAVNQLEKAVPGVNYRMEGCSFFKDATFRFEKGVAT